MGIRFRKQVKIAPGVKLNIGKKSVGVSVGGKVAGVSYNTKTGARARVTAYGTGLSYSKKLGGGAKGGKVDENSSADLATLKAIQKAGKKPIMLRPWFWALGALFVASGIFGATESLPTGLVTVAIGVLMLFGAWRAKAKGWEPFDADAFYFLLCEYSQSFAAAPEAKTLEDLLDLYERAEDAAAQMADMTEQPLVNGATPQHAVEVLARRKADVCNAFLDEYAKEVRQKAFSLSRGRRQKLEGFKLLTNDDRLPDECVAHRDELYEDMLAQLAEVEAQ